MKKPPKPKVLVLRESRASSVMSLAMAMAWSQRTSLERADYERQAETAIRSMCRAQGGRE